MTEALKTLTARKERQTPETEVMDKLQRQNGQAETAVKTNSWMQRST